MEKGTAVASKGDCPRPFCSADEGLRGRLVGIRSGGVFSSGITRFSSTAARVRSGIPERPRGRTRAPVSDAIIASIDEGFVGVAKGVRVVAAAIESSYPKGLPILGQSVPELLRCCTPGFYVTSAREKYAHRRTRKICACSV